MIPTDDDLEERIADLLVKDLASVMSNIEYGDPLPELSEDIYREIDALTIGMAPHEFAELYRNARNRAFPRVMAILRAKALPDESAKA